jgi:hypothetical protein
VRHAVKLYPEFDFLICHNNLLEVEVKRLKRLGVLLLEQTEAMSIVPHRDVSVCKDFAWKIIPPRIRPESHELWVDNDLIIRDRIPDIDEWLNKSTGIVSRGFSSLYGRFASRIDPSIDCCAGFFGLPPYFDFRARIVDLCGNEPLEEFDEQGLVVYVVSQIPGFMVVDYNYLRMWGHWQTEFGGNFPAGIHFCGANRTDRLISWDYYRFTSLP